MFRAARRHLPAPPHGLYSRVEHTLTKPARAVFAHSGDDPCRSGSAFASEARMFRTAGDACRRSPLSRQPFPAAPVPRDARLHSRPEPGPTPERRWPGPPATWSNP